MSNVLAHFRLYSFFPLLVLSMVQLVDAQCSKRFLKATIRGYKLVGVCRPCLQYTVHKDMSNRFASHYVRQYMLLSSSSFLPSFRQRRASWDCAALDAALSKRVVVATLAGHSFKSACAQLVRFSRPANCISVVEQSVRINSEQATAETKSSPSTYHERDT